MSERWKVIPAVYVILHHSNQILLQRRLNTGFMDGYFGLPSGHLVGGEPIKLAAIREVKEEIGVLINPKNLQLVHIQSRLAKDHERLDCFFIATQWKNEPTILEPDKADELKWFELDNLPKNTIDNVLLAIACWQRGINYSEFGF